MGSALWLPSSLVSVVVHRSCRCQAKQGSLGDMARWIEVSRGSRWLFLLQRGKSSVWWQGSDAARQMKPPS